MNNQNLTNAGKGRVKGSKNKVHVNDIITDERQKELLEQLYDIALNGTYEKSRISAIQILLERTLGKVPAEVHQTITETSTLQDLLKNESPLNTPEE